MSETQEKVAEGWSMPWNARKFHYFRDGKGGLKSLCGRWMLFGDSAIKPGNAGYIPGPDDCLACWRKRRAEEEEEAAIVAQSKSYEGNDYTWKDNIR